MFQVEFVIQMSCSSFYNLLEFIDFLDFRG